MTDFTGLWRVNLEKSRFHGPPQKMDVQIEHADPRLMQSVTMATPSGEERMQFVFSTDGGESVNLVRGVEGRTRAHWHGAELIIETSMKTPARDFYFRDCWSLGEDGSLVMEHRDDDLAGQRVVLNQV
jgi:hypothetical protein